MYKLKLTRRITCSYYINCNSILLCKDIEIPFIPMPGLIISDKGFEYEIIKVFWINDSQKIIAELCDESRESYSAKTVSECLKSELSNGWYID
jgi:hypothetical protein